MTTFTTFVAPVKNYINNKIFFFYFVNSFRSVFKKVTKCPLRNIKVVKLEPPYCEYSALIFFILVEKCHQ